MPEVQPHVALRRPARLRPFLNADRPKFLRQRNDLDVRIQTLRNVRDARETMRNRQMLSHLSGAFVGLLCVEVVARRVLLPYTCYEAYRFLVTHSAHASSYRRSSCR